MLIMEELRIEEFKGNEFVNDDGRYIYVGVDYQDNHLYQHVSQFEPEELREREMLLEVPEGYITGTYRLKSETTSTHLYKGSFDNIEGPMCKRGYNTPEGGFSIFRGRVSPMGICRTCMKRAQQGLGVIEIEEKK